MSSGRGIPIGGNIPIVGEDPIKRFARDAGYAAFVLIGVKVDPDTHQPRYEYVPFGADTMLQMGLVEYGKMMASAPITERQTLGLLQAVMAVDDGGHQCACSNAKSEESNDTVPPVQIVDGGVEE